jgi:hypothetical protein
MQWLSGFEIGVGVQDSITKDHIVLVQAKVLRIACAQKLYTHFHEFLGGEFRTRERAKYILTALVEQSLALVDHIHVVLVDFEPPVRLKLCKCCMLLVIMQ